MTDIVAPVITGITAPIETSVNGINDVIQIIPIVGTLLPDLNLNATQLLNNAASGAPITLQVLNRNGVAVGPTDACAATADGYSLNTPAGIAIGGNQISGLGNGTASFAGDIDAVALGNNARSEAGATASVAIGANSRVTAANSVALGAGSEANRGAVTGYTAVGLAAPQNSAGEVSVGGPGGARQITNVAAGRDNNDAVNVAQLRGVSDRVDGIDTRVTTNTTDITNISNRVTTAETNITNNSTQITNIDNRVTTAETNISNTFTQVNNVANRVTAAEANITTLQTTAVMYDDNVTYNNVTFQGAGGTRLRNVADGDVNSTSRDAVNGSQLNATNVRVTNVENVTNTHTTQIADLQTRVNNSTTNVTDIDNRVTTINNTVNNIDARTTANTTAITNLDVRVTNNETAITNVDNRVTNVTNTINTRLAVHDDAFVEINVRLAGYDQRINELNSSVGSGGNPQAVVYDTDGNGNRINRVTLAGGNTSAPVTVTNVAAGRVAADSTDAVNGSQLNATNQRVTAIEQTAMRYDDATQARATLGGANGTVIANVADGEVSETSTEAVNGRQLHETRQTSQAAMALASNSVQYDTQGRSVTFGPDGGGPVALHNVADGTVATDAVNLGQMQAGMQSTLGEAMAYTDSRFAQMNLDIGGLRQDSRSGTAGAMALSGLPQGAPGANMIAMGVGHFEGETALAIGGSAGLRDGRTVVRFGATYNSRGSAGANAGVGYSF